MKNDGAYMARALQLARLGLNTAHPNPRVGCVIVRAGEIVGEGWHRATGEPHAEVHALRAAGAQAAGATVYVTLEPCCHHGRTPPCTDALIAAGVARVVYGSTDPNPAVDGGGQRQLAAAGIAVTAGVLQADCDALNEGFACRMRTGRPLIRSKIAASLDGRTALASGASRWITGAAARADVQCWRARSGAILTGVGTVLADDPSLNVRLELGAAFRQPLRVVVDSTLRTPATARLLGLPGDTLIAHASGTAERVAALGAAGATVEALPVGSAVDLGAVLDRLGQLQVNELLVEAGPGLNGALLQAGLIDELLVYQAAHVLGDTARGMFALPALARMEDRQSFRCTDVRRVGDDLRLTYRRN
jgi:diaminohydroxyphosphoribosylaminopyrimidine deaminase/5-amino-6-(5-phosphoribosylamino)uracil reductase